MADNTVLDSGSGGDTIATDDIGGVKHQRVKVQYGDNGSATDVSASAPLPTTDNAIYVDDGDWTALSSEHVLTGGVYTASERTITDGDTAPMSLDVNGHTVTSAHAETVVLSDDISNTANLLVDEAGGFMAEANFGFYFDGTAWDRVRGTSADGALVNLGTNNDVTVAGVATAANQLADGHNVTVDNASGGSAVNIQDGGNTITVDGTVTANPASGTIDTVTTVGTVSAISAGTTIIGSTFASAATAATGTVTYYDSDLDETKIEVTDNPTSVIYSIQAFNTTDAPLFLQLWDLDADSVTVGATAPTNQYVIPGNADSDGAGFVIQFNPPKKYTTGFTVACTTNSEGSGAPGTGACIVDIEYIT